MGKILGSWSGMRKYPEQEMLADCLRGRIRYHCTTYVGMDGCRIFEVFIDGVLCKQFSLETVNSYFIRNGYSAPNRSGQAWTGIGEYWDGFQRTLEQYPPGSRTEYTDVEFCNALEQYRSQRIGDSLVSEDPIVRMFAILDRRIGKRTLTAIRDSVPHLPRWLQTFYRLRLHGEGLLPPGTEQIVPTQISSDG